MPLLHQEKTSPPPAEPAPDGPRNNTGDLTDNWPIPSSARCPERITDERYLVDEAWLISFHYHDMNAWTPVATKAYRFAIVVAVRLTEEERASPHCRGGGSEDTRLSSVSEGWNQSGDGPHVIMI
jgi:hypothetical protein